MSDPIKFTLDGARSRRSRARRSGRWRTGSAPRSRISAGCPSPATAPTAIAAPAWSRSRASGCSPPPASASRPPDMKVQIGERARQILAQDGVRAAGRRPARPRAARTTRIRAVAMGRQARGQRQPLPAARGAGARPQPSAMAVQLDACIQCNLCVRACREVQVNDVIGMAARGHHEKIVFDFDDPMGNSTCVACGECVQACPTGALMPATLVDENGVYHQRARPRRSTASAPIAASAAS